MGTHLVIILDLLDEEALILNPVHFGQFALRCSWSISDMENEIKQTINLFILVERIFTYMVVVTVI